MRTLEDYLLAQLEQPVYIVDKEGHRSQAMKDDGTPMTKYEAIATNLINKAMKGDYHVIQYIENIKHNAEVKTKRR